MALLALLLTLAEVEFCRLMGRVGFRPALVFGVGLLWILLLDGEFPTLGLLRPGVILVMLVSLAWQTAHRQGAPVADWSLTVTSGLYLGLCGASLIQLRSLPPDGLWWTLTAVPSIMLADSSAYFVGRAWGRHKMAPTLSPHKTWEGYTAGIVGGGLLTALLAVGLRALAGAEISLTWMHGLILGLIIAALAPMGDLAISMVKRRAGAKDSGRMLPGHGGALDRVDSVLWAAVLGYFYVLWFVR